MLHEIIAHHPLTDTPYNKLAFVRINQHGTPLYRVLGVQRHESAAPTALRSAFLRYGGRCFYCETRLKPQKPSDMSLDHLVAKANGGTNLLHNIALACKKCNQDKRASELPNFKAEAAALYLRALERHIADCIRCVAGPALIGLAKSID